MTTPPPQPPRTPESQDPHRLQREMLGAYALGHLEGAEEAAMRAHVESCAACSRDLAELEPAVQALSHLTATNSSSTGEPPPDLVTRVVSSVAAERQARQRGYRGRMVLIAAAAVPAVLAIGGIGAVVGHNAADDPGLAAPAVPIEDVRVKTTGKVVEASAGVVAHTWGVEIKLQALGLRKGASYSAVVTTTDGRERSAGAFVGTGDAEMNCNLNSDVLRDDAARFAVLDEEGRTVLSAAL